MPANVDARMTVTATAAAGMDVQQLAAMMRGKAERARRRLDAIRRGLHD